jgi:hypothetical protein
MAGAKSQALQLPILQPGNDTTERNAKFELLADGSLKGTVTVSRFGASAARSRGFFIAASDKEKREDLENSLRRDFSQFQVGSEEIENARDLEKQMILHYDVSASAYAKSAGDLFLVRPRVLGSHVTQMHEEKRKYPVEFAETGDWRDSFDVAIPAGYAADEVPDPVNVDVGFASYRSEVKVNGNVLHYSREYMVKKLEIAPDQYVDLEKLEGQINADENRSAVLKKQ